MKNILKFTRLSSNPTHSENDFLYKEMSDFSATINIWTNKHISMGVLFFVGSVMGKWRVALLKKDSITTQLYSLGIKLSFGLHQFWVFYTKWVVCSIQNPGTPAINGNSTDSTPNRVMAMNGCAWKLCVWFLSDF